MPEQQTRRLIRPRSAEEYDRDETEAPRRRLQREEPDTTLRSNRPHPSERRSRREDADDDRGLAVGKGWGGYARTKANAPSQFTKLLRVTDEEKLIMFLEDGPYASFLQHWCEWVAKGQRMSYICLQDRCPLDEVDPKPSARVRFNIMDCSVDPPDLTTFECGVSITEDLNDYAEKDPLAGRYFAVGMKGSQKSRRTQIRPVKIRDLKEDWDFEPLSEDTIAQFDNKLWDDTSLEIDTRAELQRVADAFNE
jgi:hypothetical protein